MVREMTATPSGGVRSFPSLLISLVASGRAAARASSRAA
jgi:hypothetical protein